MDLDGDSDRGLDTAVTRLLRGKKFRGAADGRANGDRRGKAEAIGAVIDAH